MSAAKVSKAVLDLLTPDELRGDDDDEGTEIQKEAKPRKDLSEIDKLLTPKNLIDTPDPLAGTIGELTPDELRDVVDDPRLIPDPTGLLPDWAREKKSAGDVDELTPAKVKTPVVEEAKITLAAWAEKWAKDQTEKTDNEKLEREIEARKVEDENREIRESFERVIAAKDAARTTADLIPDHYKIQE